LKITSVSDDGSQTLLKVIKNPITDHFPTGSRKIGNSLITILAIETF